MAKQTTVAIDIATGIITIQSTTNVEVGESKVKLNVNRPSPVVNIKREDLTGEQQARYDDFAKLITELTGEK